MNWKELYALVNENIKNAVSGLYKPAGDVTFAELPELSQSVLGYTYTVTDAFTTDSRFTDYDTETQTGHSFPADTEVAVIVTGTTENPVYMFNVMGGIMDGYATKGDLDNYVEKEAGKGLSTNDYTDADKALVQNSPITVTAIGAEITASTAQGNLNALTIYGKSEVVDGAIVSAGEGWETVDLGTLPWTYSMEYQNFVATITGILEPVETGDRLTGLLTPNYPPSLDYRLINQTNKSIIKVASSIYIKDNTYGSDATALKTAMSGVILAYQLADPSQNNAIAIKTDDGTGINGTMAVLTTGTPLRGIPDTDVRDVMEWNGSAGSVTKNCDEVDLGTLNWNQNTDNEPFFYAGGISNKVKATPNDQIANILIDKYTATSRHSLVNGEINNVIAINSSGTIQIRDTAYTDPTAFKTAMSGVMLVYERATPTTEQLTTTENNSFAGLRTFTPQTHAQNNAGADMTIEAYAGTANGEAVNELKQNVQSEISALKITQSAPLTLTVADWSSNQQTVTYAHDTSKRNVIDVDPASVEEWAICGVLAISETATGITFKCSTVPENALTFRVTSMEVN